MTWPRSRHSPMQRERQLISEIFTCRQMPPCRPPLDSKGFAEHVSLPNDNSVRRTYLISIQSKELNGVQKKPRFKKNDVTDSMPEFRFR